VSNGALFAVGFLITALVVFAIGGLVYAAMLDQRYQDEMDDSAEKPAGSTAER
jgi:hypothetical protein